MSNDIVLTEQQLEKLRHTLGLNYHDTITRNYFHAGPEGEDADLVALKAAGLMFSRKAPAFCAEGDVVFHATEAGKEYAMARQPVRKPVKRTVWQQFISSDMDNFLDFLEIESPRYEVCTKRLHPSEDPLGVQLFNLHLMPFRTFYRMISPRGTGEWCETKKAAKASYKADMKARKDKVKEAKASNAQLAASA